MTLAELIEQQQEDIIEWWLVQVRPLAPRPDLSREELLDTLPDFLAELGRALRPLEGASVTAAPPERSPVAEAHGQQRHRLGYTPAQVLREYPLLQEAILRVAAARGAQVRAWEGVLLARCLGTATAEALGPFSTAGERGLTRREVADATERARLEAEREELLERARRARAEAEAERQKLRAIFEQAPISIVIIEGPQHTIAFANPVYRKLIGGRDILGKPLAEALPDIAAQGYGQLLDQVMASNTPFVGKEVPVKLPRPAEGEQVEYMNFVYQPMHDAEGQVRGVLACGYDVTEQVLARQASEGLAREVQVRADFEQKLIGIVGHDLRQPLQAIAMSAALLLRHQAPEGRARATAHRILSAAERAQRMLGDVLDFTQVRLGGGIPLRREQADLSSLVRAAVEEVEATFPGGQVALAVEGSGWGWWDEDRLRQVLDNLLANALTHGSPEAPVRLVLEGRGEDAVLLTVHNQGPPIPPELLPRLFEPMTRGATPSGKQRSVGLGLFIVRHLVEAHGGDVQVASSPRDGTTFTLRLPRGAQARLSASPPSSARGGGT